MEKKKLSRKSPDVLEKLTEVATAKRNAEVVTLREWYETTPEHTQEIVEYIEKYKQLGRLGKELHNRNVPRVTERFGDGIRTLVEATYNREILNFSAPICAILCLKK